MYTRRRSTVIEYPFRRKRVHDDNPFCSLYTDIRYAICIRATCPEAKVPRAKYYENFLFEIRLKFYPQNFAVFG